MQTLSVPTKQIELALSANREIVTTLGGVFAAYPVPNGGDRAILAALREFGTGLLGLLPAWRAKTATEVPTEALDEARLAHAEIRAATLQACELGRVPSDLASTIAATLEVFGEGLDSLALGNRDTLPAPACV